MNDEERMLLRTFNREAFHDALARWVAALLEDASTDELESAVWHAYELLVEKGDDNDARGMTIHVEWVEDCTYASDEMILAVTHLWPLPYARREDIIRPLREKIHAISHIRGLSGSVGLAS